MTCKWEELTAHDFPAAASKAGYTCMVPLGVLEKHGEHLPVGADAFFVEAVAERAAALEPVVVFPRYYFTQIHEAKQWPGTVAVSHDTLFRLLDEVCGEIARNGFKKIVLMNGHGGNEFFVEYFGQYLLQHPREHATYIIRLSDYLFPVTQSPEWKAKMVSKFDYHGGEAETSMVMKLRPDLVKLSDAAPESVAQGRLNHLPGGRTPMWWYAAYPDHYAGDARPATEEKGELLLKRCVEQVAILLKAIKADKAEAALEAEYFSRIRH